MNHEQETAVWRELVRQERFGRLMAGQCYQEGYCHALMEALGGDNYYPSTSAQSQCDPRRCIYFYRHDHCLRTAPLFMEGWDKGRATGQAWLENLDASHWNGRVCEECGETLTGRQQRFCSTRCRVAAHRAARVAV